VSGKYRQPAQSVGAVLPRSNNWPGLIGPGNFVPTEMLVFGKI
jgi:hypothetical protein